MPMRWNAVLARMGVPTGDKRIIAPGALTNRDLPLPLMWQRVSGQGHDGAVTVGSIDELTIDNETGMVTGSGRFLDVRGADDARRQVDAGVTGPSVDLFDDIDIIEVQKLIKSGVVGPDITSNMDDMTYVIDDDDMVIITEARIAGATLVSIPAFANVSISMQEVETMSLDLCPEGCETDHAHVVMPAGRTETGHDYSLTASVTTFPRPSASLFENPNLSGPMPLTVFDNGQVFGHIAPWDTCHVGFEDCRTAPSSPSGYAHYMVHDEHTDAGVIPTGVISVGGGHADPQLGFVAAVQHYDDVSAQVARVVVGEDQWGIWAAGRILPWADPVKVEQFRSSPISGDWRRRGGALELIAVCSVNTPGFPIPRTRARAGFALVEGAKQMKSLQLGLGPLTRYTGTPEQFKIEQPETFTMEYDQETARAKWAWATKGR